MAAGLELFPTVYFHHVFGFRTPTLEVSYLVTIPTLPGSFFILHSLDLVSSDLLVFCGWQAKFSVRLRMAVCQ